MPPWDALPYFLPPTGGQVAPGGAPGIANVLAEADPNRVVLIIGGGSSTAYVTPVQSEAAAGRGIPVGISGGPLVLTHEEHGALVNIAWYVAEGAGSPATFVALSLQSWPEDANERAAAKQWLRERRNLLDALARAQSTP